MGSCGGYTNVLKGLVQFIVCALLQVDQGPEGVYRANKHNLYNYMYIIICNILCTHFLNRTVLSVHD